MPTQTDWQAPVSEYLAGKDFIGLSAVARDVFRLACGQVDSATWRKLAFVVSRCGFKSTYIAGAGNVWQRKAPTPAPELPL
jgi:hypothetical protein